jgi:hypothetical protein
MNAAKKFTATNDPVALTENETPWLLSRRFFVV